MKLLFTLFYGLFLLLLVPRFESQQQIKTQHHESYLENFDQFITELSTLKAHAETQNLKIEVLQKHVNSSRLAYKKIEFILDYFEPKYCNLHVNGGPIIKLDRESDDQGVIPPNGLQKLDELVFETDTLMVKAEVPELISELLDRTILLRGGHQSINISDKQLIEAIRSSIVRIFTLGLTGFDTPGSSNGIPEAIVSVNAIRHALNLLPQESREQKLSYIEILQKLDLAKTLLRDAENFEQLDRLNYLTQVTNPLYKLLGEYQHSIDIQLDNFMSHAQDYTAINLFDESFVNTNYFNELSYLPLENESSIALGKLLFYDPILSKNIDLSCASCHEPSKAFTDGLSISKTNRFNQNALRNTPTLIDVAYSNRYFWDMREYNLERQVAHVLKDSLEFNLSFEEVATRLKQSKEYKDLFRSTYKNIAPEPINSRSIANAIAAYVNTLKSFNSPFDKYVRGELDHIPSEVISGFNLFMGKAACGTCHFAPVFNGTVPPFYIDSESEVLGVPISFDTLNPIIGKDRGRINNGLKKENLAHLDRSFKTVTVRNIAATGPYMHHGGFSTLEEVLQFYNMGGGQGMGLEVENQTLSSAPLNLSIEEQEDIIHFLEALTDTSALNHTMPELPKFDNPYWNRRHLPKVYD